MTRLPLWRLISGFAILGALVAVLLWMAPTYVRDYELKRYLRTRALSANSEAELATDIVGKAAGLGLPVRTEDLRITPSGSGFHIDMRYAVHVPVIEADLHFHSSVDSPARR